LSLSLLALIALPIGAALLLAARHVLRQQRRIERSAHELNQHNRELATLNRTLHAIGSSAHLAEMRDAALQGALELSGFTGGVLCLRDTAQGQLSVSARLNACGLFDCAADDSPLRDELCPAMAAELAGMTMPLLQAADAPGYLPACGNVRDATVRWHAYFPLRGQQRVIGILCLYTRQDTRPEQRRIDLTQELCTPIAIALENFQLYAQAQQQAAMLEQRVEERTRKLSDTTRLLDSVLEHSPNLIFYKDAELRFLGCNQRYEQTFGVSRQTLIGKQLNELDFLPESIRQRAESEQRRLLTEGGHQSHEATLTFADGLPHQVLLFLSTWQHDDGTPGGLIGEVIDISPLKQSETALRAAEARQRSLTEELQRILQYSLDAICVFDEHLKFQRASPACEHLWGYRAEQLIGSSYLDHIPAEAHPATLTTLQSIRNGSSAPRTLEARFLRQDGTIAHISWSVVWSPAERLWYGIARDDSERRRLLGELKSRHAQLQAYAEELAGARDAAQAADRAKSAFLATMSHETRTPLNSILGFTGILLQELAGPLNDEQKKQLTMVQNSSRHLLALINDILDLSKIEAGELRFGHHAFSLADSINRVTDIITPLAQAKALQLSIDTTSSIAPMTGDARRLEQILLNLLSNAIKFTEKGTVSLQVEPVAGYTTNAAVPAVRLRISDTGIGIRQSDMALLFQPFRQIDSGLTRLHEGTGLGLAICQRLTTLMGGRLEARSQWGQGSEFVVTLPLHLPVDAAPPIRDKLPLAKPTAPQQ
jgi:PAS domain S-box-containing protein